MPRMERPPLPQPPQQADAAPTSLWVLSSLDCKHPEVLRARLQCLRLEQRERPSPTGGRRCDTVLCTRPSPEVLGCPEFKALLCSWSVHVGTSRKAEQQCPELGSLDVGTE